MRATRSPASGGRVFLLGDRSLKWPLRGHRSLRSGPGILALERGSARPRLQGRGAAPL